MKNKPRKYTLSELSTFENKWQITLPPDYREYLVQVGGGEFTDSIVSLLEDWCAPDGDEKLPFDFLKCEFPHTQAWHDVSLDDKSGYASDYFHHRHIQGSMRIVNTGCEGYLLLVVSGPERGNVWVDDRGCNFTGIWPTHKTFKQLVDEHNSTARRTGRFLSRIVTKIASI